MFSRLPKETLNLKKMLKAWWMSVWKSCFLVVARVDILEKENLACGAARWSFCHGEGGIWKLLEVHFTTNHLRVCELKSSIGYRKW